MKNRTNVHVKRISDRNIFWLGVLVVIFLSHYYLYVEVGQYLPPWQEGLWLLIGLLAMLSSAAAGRLSAPKRETKHMSLQAGIQKFGAAWNIMVVLVSAFMLAFHFFAGSAQRHFAISWALAFAVCAYGVYEARTIRTVSFPLITDKLPENVDRLRIVQLSDLHISPYMNLGHVSRVVAATVAANPDVIVITGDLVDGVVGNDEGVLPYYQPFARKLCEMADAQPRLGIWAIPGNHDYYEGFQNSTDFIKMACIELLQCACVDLGDLVIVGADDLDHLRPSETIPGMSRSEELLQTLEEDEKEKFILFLRHRPVVEPSTVGRFDLQLSGHTHGGQVVVLPSSRHKIPGRPRGLLALEKGSYLYVSNGAGFVGPPMRFLAPAEIVVVDLIRRDSVTEKEEKA